MENEQNKPMQTPAPYAAGTGSVGSIISTNG